MGVYVNCSIYCNGVEIIVVFHGSHHLGSSIRMQNYGSIILILYPIINAGHVAR